MKTLISLYNEATSTITQAIHDLTQEATTANLLDPLCANKLRVVAKILSDAINSIGVFNYSDKLIFGNTTGLLSTLNSAAKLCESYAVASAGSDRLFWCKHAYSLRTRTEKIATDLLHTAEHSSSLTALPLFEESLALLRLSCALLAQNINLEDKVLFYIQGALRLAASDPLVPLARSIMQTHQRN